MTLRILTVFFFMISTFALKAQQRDVPEFDGYHKNVFVERQGATLGYGVNFDRRFFKGRMGGLGFRAGAGLSFILQGSFYGNSTYFSFNFPLEVNHLLGKRKSSLVTGIGIIPSYYSYTETYSGITYKSSGFRYAGTFANIGYRLQPRNRGFMLQFTWTPILDNYNYFIWNNFGLGLGFGFK